ncbi:MAG: TIGR02266 family protein [Deltaproteobacteria bacterium]|nr:TIGR02266 family protein [Deltaproteobacteria bacterium]
MAQDKRITPRIATKIEITFKEPKSFIKTYMLNVSNGGVFISTEDPLSLDSQVALIMQLPEQKEQMEITGRVVWNNPRGRKNSFPKGMGIQFVDLSAEHKEIIESFVAKYRKEIEHHSLL